jgi:hypothetical protein
VIAVKDEYRPRFGRQLLSLWSGPFASEYEGFATELPKHDGFMLDIPYQIKVRVECPAPRTQENYEQVDAAIDAAFQQAEKEHRDGYDSRGTAGPGADAAGPEQAGEGR